MNEQNNDHTLLVSGLCVDDRSVCTNVLLKAGENIVRRASNSKAIVYYLMTSRSIVVDREVSPIFVKLSKSLLAWTRLKIQFQSIILSLEQSSPNPLYSPNPSYLGDASSKNRAIYGKKLSVTKHTCDRAFGSGSKFSDRLFWKIATAEKQDHGNPSPIYFLATY